MLVDSESAVDPSPNGSAANQTLSSSTPPSPSSTGDGNNLPPPSSSSDQVSPISDNPTTTNDIGETALGFDPLENADVIQSDELPQPKPYRQPPKSNKKKKKEKRPPKPKPPPPPVEELPPPEPMTPPKTHPLIFSSLLLLRSMHDEGEFELEKGWPTMEIFETALEEPVLRPELLGAILSRLTVSQSELRRLKSQGTLDTRPMSEWSRDLHRVVNGWYISKTRSETKLTEFDELIKQIKETEPQQDDDQEADDLLENLPERREELVAEKEYWQHFLEPIGVETCPFRVLGDDYFPETEDLKPRFEELTFELRVLILDCLCQWNISSERKALCDALRIFPDGSPCMRAKVLGHDDFGAVYLYNPFVAPLRIFRENQTELIASRKEKHKFEIDAVKSKPATKPLGKRELKRLEQLAKEAEKKKSKKKGGRQKRNTRSEKKDKEEDEEEEEEDPPFEILRSSGRIRKPREIVHFGADSFFGKNKSKLAVVEEEDDEEASDNHQAGRRRKPASENDQFTPKERKAYERKTLTIRNARGPLAYSFETLTGDVLGMEKLIEQLKNEKCCSRIMLDGMEDIMKDANEYYEEQLAVVREMAVAIHKIEGTRKRSSRLAVLEAERMAEEEERRLRRLEEDESKRAENQRLRSLRTRQPPPSKKTRLVPSRACKEDGTPYRDGDDEDDYEFEPPYQNVEEEEVDQQQEHQEDVGQGNTSLENNGVDNKDASSSIPFITTTTTTTTTTPVEPSSHYEDNFNLYNNNNSNFLNKAPPNFSFNSNFYPVPPTIPVPTTMPNHYFPSPYVPGAIFPSNNRWAMTDFWTCSRCTIINLPINLSCQRCGLVRPR